MLIVFRFTVEKSTGRLNVNNIGRLICQVTLLATFVDIKPKLESLELVPEPLPLHAVSAHPLIRAHTEARVDADWSFNMRDLVCVCTR
jgi:hypothetical protein